MKDGQELPPEEREEYVLLEETGGTNYKAMYDWEPGTKLIRISKWLSGNGCGVKQAYFIAKDKGYSDEIAWQDHVKPVIGQIELF